MSVIATQTVITNDELGYKITLDDSQLIISCSEGDIIVQRAGEIPVQEVVASLATDLAYLAGKDTVDREFTEVNAKAKREPVQTPIKPYHLDTLRLCRESFLGRKSFSSNQARVAYKNRYGRKVKIDSMTCYLNRLAKEGDLEKISECKYRVISTADFLLPVEKTLSPKAWLDLQDGAI